MSFKLASEATKRNEHGYATDAWKGPEGKFEAQGDSANGNHPGSKQVPWAGHRWWIPRIGHLHWHLGVRAAFSDQLVAGFAVRG